MLAQRQPVDADLTAPQGEQADQGLEQGGFAGAVWPDDGNLRAVRNFEA